MSKAAHRRRFWVAAAGSIPMATAMIAGVAMTAPAAHADSGTGAGTSPGSGPGKRTPAGGSRPQWATAAADRGAAPAAQTITTRVYLTGQDPAGLAAAARAVADPSSPLYRRYLTPDQIKAQFGAAPAQVAAVTNWLTGAGLSVSHSSSDWIDATGPIAAVQQAFGTQIKNFALPDGTVHYAPASAAQLPVDVASAVSGVSGLSSMVKVNRVDSSKKHVMDATNGIADCSAYWGEKTSAQFPKDANGTNAPVDTCAYTPKQLRDAYGITKSGLTGKGATIAVIDWFASPTMAADSDRFSTSHGDKPFAPGQYSEVVTPSQWQHLPNGNDPTSCGDASGEESLDVDMAHGLAPDANIVYVGANSCYDADLIAAEEYVVDHHAADVVSNSWGGLLHTSDQGDEDPAVMAAYDRVFQKGALEGIGFDFSSGDCGDDDPANFTGGGANCAPDSARKQTEWPTSSQWVTSVGGTTLATKQDGSYAWELPMGDNLSVALPGDPAWTPATKPIFLGGGGGTSEDVTQPWYQSAVVPASLSGKLMSGQTAKQAMRTVPDVAMNGSLATAVLVGQTDPASGVYSETDSGGTSVAAPEFSAMQALAKQAAGGQAVGFANPSIYGLAGTPSFHDVTQQAAGQPSTVDAVYEYVSTATNQFSGALFTVGKDTSLTAAAGYDTATGLGSPTDVYLTSVRPTTAYPANTGPQQGGGTTVQRTWGQDRYATGIRISQTGFADHSAPAVVLATGDNFPDALSGVSLAKKLGAPLLLTPTASADARVVAEVHRVLAAGGKVYVLGGASAVTPAVVGALGLPAAQIQRIGGSDRFDTSLRIAAALGSPKNVVLATGRNFPDALAAGPYASGVFTNADGSPAAILLTDDAAVPGPVRQYLATATGVAAVGGQAVKAAANAGLSNVVARFQGYDRYDTAAQVAKTFPVGEKMAGVAVGTKFADALTGAAYVAENGGPLVLTDTAGLSPSTLDALSDIRTKFAYTGQVDVFGGPAAVSDATLRQIAQAVGGNIVG